MEEKPSEDILPIAEVYIKEEVIDDIKVEVQSEDENLDEFSPVEDHDDDSLIKPLKYETVCNSNGLPREIEERDDESSDEQNSNSALLQCAVCGKRYLTASSLSAHLSKQHRITLGPRYTCHICGALGQSKATLKRHLKRTHGADSVTTPEFLKKCRHCSQGQPTQEALYTHIATAHPEELEKYHCCPKCSALFSSRPSLIRHLGRIHPGVEFPEYDTKHCEKCGDGFKSSAALRKHLKENHPESLLHQCQKCKATFKYSYLLARHTKSAHRERTEKPVKLWHKCEFCEREYRTQSRMERHIKLLHINPQTRVFRCTVCDITFATNNLRVQHYRAVHRKRKQPNCSECSKSFETVDELLVHRQEHKIDCPFCNKQFVRRDTLREHLLIHTGPRLPCPYCSKTFTQSSNLKRHIRIHTGEKPYKCTFCSKRFGDKSACNSHIRVHTGAERCMCHICGASFSKRQKLNYHMRKHTGEGLLHCPLCTKPTTNSYALKKHMESHQQPLLKVLTNTGIASAAEDWHEITLKALHNLAQLAAQKCSELTAAREAKGKKIFESEDTKDVQNTNTDISREDSSPGAENFTSTFTDQKQIMRKSKLKTKTSQKGETGSDENSGRDSSTNHRETVLKNRESLDGDSSSEENCPIDLTSAKDYLHKTEEDELLERENSESLPDNEHEPSGSMALQGSPSDVLFHLLETIVESHYRTFQTTDVRPTLGDQLVEQCLEIMMLDDTSKIVGDDGKIDNTNTHSVFSCDSGARNDGDLSDASLNEDGNCVDTISKEEVESPEEEEEFDTASVQDIRDLPTTKIKKEEYFSSSLSTNSTNGMGLFQRELLGEDVNASSASLSSEASTDSEHISEALLNMKNSPCEETEEARNLKQNEKRIKYKADGKKRKLTSKKSNANNDDKLLKKAKYNNKFNLKPKDIEDICEDSQAVPQLNLSPKRRSRRNCSSPSVNVSFKAYIHTNGWSDA